MLMVLPVPDSTSLSLTVTVLQFLNVTVVNFASSGAPPGPVSSASTIHSAQLPCRVTLLGAVATKNNPKPPVRLARNKSAELAFAEPVSSGRHWIQHMNSSPADAGGRLLIQKEPAGNHSHHGLN